VIDNTEGNCSSYSTVIRTKYQLKMKIFPLQQFWTYTCIVLYT